MQPFRAILAGACILVLLGLAGCSPSSPARPAAQAAAPVAPGSGVTQANTATLPDEGSPAAEPGLGSLVALGTDRAGAPSAASDIRIPGGEFDMGDPMGSWDPERSGDALPVHRVRLSAFYLAKYLTTNQDFLAFLNDGISRGQLEVREGVVYASGGVDAYAFTREYAYAYSLGFDGSDFSILDFRASHPVVGVQWRGAAAYCNWLSEQKGLSPCYDLGTGACDFTRNGYRLPTEAEWEYAARAGQADPLADPASGASLEGPVRLPGPGPFQGAGPSTYPWTTPVGFFDGSLRYRSDFRWPGTATAYQTANAANGFGLFDMQGNVWQFVQDWYLGNDYGQSPSADPRGPDTGSLMPDGSTCHVLRGGSWFGDRGLRVSDRQPAYFRGALGPKLSWCLVGFRVARNAAPLALHRGVSF